MSDAAATMCHCGKPLHYIDPKAKAIADRVVAECGPYIKISVGNRSWLVQRHFVFLHGLKADELPTLGFKEISRAEPGAGKTGA